MRKSSDGQRPSFIENGFVGKREPKVFSVLINLIVGDIAHFAPDEFLLGGGTPFADTTGEDIITRAVQSTSVKRTGYSGLMIPVMEDKLLARRWAEGTFNMDSMLAYSAVCAGVLDTVPLPGDVSEEQIARILGDVAWLAFRWSKPLPARLLPVPGKHAGEQTEFSSAALTKTTIQPLRGTSR